ncbi:hypothetical protein BDA96_09G046100 [Sorghum bicolor]|uniref:Sulfite oxidase n=1 Tax=Sorghum bicolor TaxID=4558 RepID=A0A921U3V0_SORBI|nr:hypothetical protein BDA96_09G046100 [Sorghum bicolor]
MAQSALRGPSDYSSEPPRHPSLRINAKEPFNAEPARRDLAASYITPVDLFFKRNHGPIPILDDIDSYYVTIGGLVGEPRRLSLDDIRKLPKYNVTATLQCAGNRRTEMSRSRKVRGVGWDVCALGNATWGGAKLSDVLQLVCVPYHTEITMAGGKHVEFISVDQCPEEKGGPYRASIPLGQATNPAADVLLAYEMNGEVLKRDHGYPLRAIVPGVIGARSVKWLDKIDIIEEESKGFFMQKDYKMFPPSVDWDNIVWSTRKPQMDYPVQVTVAGYALSGGGRGIERVDISPDGGKSWIEAHRYQKHDVPYVTSDISCDKWAWVLFKAVVNVKGDTVIVSKAVDSSANVQPESVESIWNLRGILNTCWHRVHLLATPNLRSFM